MTLDDLQKIYHAAWRDDEGCNPQRAGIAAVVRALRDEMMREFERCDSCSGIEHVEPFFDEILGDAGEKVAEYTGGMNDLCVTDPAPAVCVWVADVQFRDAFTTECGYVAGKRPAGSPCICAKPIKFTEAK